MTVMKKVLLLGGTGLAGRAIRQSLLKDYAVTVTAGHHEPEGGYQLSVEDTGGLLRVLEREDPAVVISSITGPFDAQLRFHKTLADWLKERGRKLFFLSSMNVFDGDSTKPVDENSVPVPGSDYGRFKRDCEVLLQNALGKALAILRLSAVWSDTCKRIDILRAYSRSQEKLETYAGYQINVILASQVGAYVRFILDQGLSGVFHVGSEDMVDYHAFERAVCEELGLPTPNFRVLKEDPPAFLAALPTIREIPEELRTKAAEVLAGITGRESNSREALYGTEKTVI